MATAHCSRLRLRRGGRSHRRRRGLRSCVLLPPDVPPSPERGPLPGWASGKRGWREPPEGKGCRE
eukprot:13147737-Alexandrium_andersonii.AAC.1